MLGLEAENRIPWELFPIFGAMGRLATGEKAGFGGAALHPAGISQPKTAVTDYVAPTRRGRPRSYGSLG